MKHRILGLLIGLIGLGEAYGGSALYFVGGFNNWDIGHPTAVNAGADGVYEAEIDFSNNREFKLSTVDPQGDWGRFDTGTLYPLSDTKEDEWIALEKHEKSANIKAPSKRQLTVKVDLENMRMMFSAGVSERAPWSGTLPLMHINTEDNTPITSKVGNAFSQGRGDNPRFIFDHPEFSQHWIGGFYALPSFAEEVKRVWGTFLNGGQERLNEELVCRAGEIAAAAVCDAKRWPRYAHADVEAQAKRLAGWLGNSVEWLKKQWGADASVGNVASDGIEISVNDGKMNVRSNRDTEMAVYRIDGTWRMLTVKEGWNSFGLDSGFYIVGGRKVMIGR